VLLVFLVRAFLLHRADLLLTVTIVLILIGAIGVIVSAAAYRSRPQMIGAQGGVPRPLGYTDEGRPVFPIVGYTSDGSPVTADRVHGYQFYNPSTDGMAVTALICAFVAAPLAIPFGHIARAQIRRTGEQGAGMALAGLIIGYLWLGLVVIGVLGLLLYARM
jgi:hypothetical protein